jgi:hypothetical protein
MRFVSLGATSAYLLRGVRRLDNVKTPLIGNSRRRSPAQRRRSEKERPASPTGMQVKPDVAPTDIQKQDQGGVAAERRVRSVPNYERSRGWYGDVLRQRALMAEKSEAERAAWSHKG